MRSALLEVFFRFQMNFFGTLEFGLGCFIWKFARIHSARTDEVKRIGWRWILHQTPKIPVWTWILIHFCIDTNCAHRNNGIRIGNRKIAFRSDSNSWASRKQFWLPIQTVVELCQNHLSIYHSAGKSGAVSCNRRTEHDIRHFCRATALWLGSLNGRLAAVFECARHVIDTSRLAAGMGISSWDTFQGILGRRASEQTTNMQEDAFPVAAIAREKMYSKRGA